MSTNKITSSALTQMSAEDLLSLNVQDVQLVTDVPVMPDGNYHFTVKVVEVGQVGKEDKPALQLEVELTGCESTTNPDDMKLIAELDLANNPVIYKENFMLQAKDGFGIRSYLTFIAGWSAATGVTNALDSIPRLPGATGVLRLTQRTYLPENAADAPENYRHSNRLRVQDTIWN